MNILYSRVPSSVIVWIKVNTSVIILIIQLLMEFILVMSAKKSVYPDTVFVFQLSWFVNTDAYLRVYD